MRWGNINMQKTKIKNAIAVSGVIGGILALNSVKAHAVELMAYPMMVTNKILIADHQIKDKL